MIDTMSQASNLYKDKWLVELVDGRQQIVYTKHGYLSMELNDLKQEIANKWQMSFEELNNKIVKLTCLDECFIDGFFARSLLILYLRRHKIEHDEEDVKQAFVNNKYYKVDKHSGGICLLLYYINN